MVLTDQKIYIDGYSLSGDWKRGALDFTAKELDATVGGHKTFVGMAGLKRMVGRWEGLFQAGLSPQLVDPTLFGAFAVADKVMSMWPVGEAVGDIGYSAKSTLLRYSPFEPGQHGELLGFAADVHAAGVVIRPTLMATGAKTSTANGASQQLGQVLAAQKLYAFMHVLAVSGTTPTLDVKVQSDDSAGFGTPTDRITFAQQTALGAVWATPVAGAITDDHWRVTWTLGGTGSPSFTFVVGVAIQ